ncbi:MAG: Nif3-like dinuclear metal center hexameric protein [Spirochaetes bacterium]|nr:Nif3-like dinuclear metal center hexameric protein [Spirochaetota bacterium]
MKIETLIQLLDSNLRPEIQEGYDNSGSQVIFSGTEVESILLALDISGLVVDEALSRGAGLIITHHPMFFSPVKKILPADPRSSIIINLIERRLNVYAAHTNLDKLFYDKLALALGLQNVRLLYPDASIDDDTPVGYGITARLDPPVSLRDLLESVRSRLKLEFLLYAGEVDRKISSLAVLNGAGGRYIEKIAAENPVDCVITGDVGYHHVKSACDRGMAVIDAGHYGTEAVLLGFLRDRISDYLTKQQGSANIRIYLSEAEKNPIRTYWLGHE